MATEELREGLLKFLAPGEREVPLRQIPFRFANEGMMKGLVTVCYP